MQAGNIKISHALRVQSYEVTGDKKIAFGKCVRAVDKELMQALWLSMEENAHSRDNGFLGYVHRKGLRSSALSI